MDDGWRRARVCLCLSFCGYSGLAGPRGIRLLSGHRAEFARHCYQLPYWQGTGARSRERIPCAAMADIALSPLHVLASSSFWIESSLPQTAKCAERTAARVLGSSFPSRLESTTRVEKEAADSIRIQASCPSLCLDMLYKENVSSCLKDCHPAFHDKAARNRDNSPNVSWSMFLADIHVLSPPAHLPWAQKLPRRALEKSTMAEALSLTGLPAGTTPSGHSVNCRSAPG